MSNLNFPPSGSSPLTITCLGAGYVGGPTMAMIASRCPEHRVIVCDPDQRKIAAWQTDTLPIYEPRLLEYVQNCRGRNLEFTTNVQEAIIAADIIFVSVGTPTKVHGIGKGSASNVKYLELCARDIARFARSSKVIVEKSTVPVRSADTLKRILSSNAPEGILFPIVNNPEFLAEGTAISDLEHPDRVLIGGEQTDLGHAAVACLASIYAHWVPRERIITTNLWSSECSKLVANAFLAQRISSINAISEFCEATGADVDEVARAVGSDSRVGSKFLRTSVGFGGSCFKKDICNLVYMARTLGLHAVADYWDQVLIMNEHQKSRFVSKIVTNMFNTVTSKKIAVFGFAFKKDTGDTRETPALEVVAQLVAEDAQIAIYDPKVTDETLWEDLGPVEGARDHVTHVYDPYEAAAGAHAIVICTEWDEFKTYDYQRLYDSMIKPAFVFDGRNILDLPRLFEIGFEVHSLGRRPLTRFVSE